jgi:hypothetical protein
MRLCDTYKTDVENGRELLILTNNKAVGYEWCVAYVRAIVCFIRRRPGNGNDGDRSSEILLVLIEER